MAVTRQHPVTILALAGLGVLGVLLAIVWPVATIALAMAALLCAVALPPALGLVG